MSFVRHDAVGDVLRADLREAETKKQGEHSSDYRQLMCRHGSNAGGPTVTGAGQRKRGSSALLLGAECN